MLSRMASLKRQDLNKDLAYNVRHQNTEDKNKILRNEKALPIKE